jgi:tryptophan synthase alpha chain
MALSIDSINKIANKFTALKAEGRAAFLTFTMAGDPDYDTALTIMKGLPAAGVDIIELGMPFTDPSADGPAIDKAAQRALKAGASMIATLKMVREFRVDDATTPIILMGYFNPIMAYGIDSFLRDAASAGVDGLIIVDLPPEEDSELRLPAKDAGIHLIRLATPTTVGERLHAVLDDASGFVYYVAVAGITGGKSAGEDDICEAMQRLKSVTDLPICVGFGIRTPEQAAIIARHADGAVVGSAIVDIIANNLDDHGSANTKLTDETLSFVSNLANGVKSAKK